MRFENRTIYIYFCDGKRMLDITFLLLFVCLRLDQFYATHLYQYMLIGNF